MTFIKIAVVIWFLLVLFGIGQVLQDFQGKDDKE